MEIRQQSFFEAPPFWLVDWEGVNGFIDGLERGQAWTVGHSAGGLPIRAVAYGQREELVRRTTFSGAVAAGHGNLSVLNFTSGAAVTIDAIDAGHGRVWVGGTYIAPVSLDGSSLDFPPSDNGDVFVCDVTDGNVAPCLRLGADGLDQLNGIHVLDSSHVALTGSYEGTWVGLASQGPIDRPAQQDDIWVAVVEDDNDIVWWQGAGSFTDNIGEDITSVMRDGQRHLVVAASSVDEFDVGSFRLDGPGAAIMYYTDDGMLLDLIPVQSAPDKHVVYPRTAVTNALNEVLVTGEFRSNQDMGTAGLSVGSLFVSGPPTKRSNGFAAVLDASGTPTSAFLIGSNHMPGTDTVANDSGIDGAVSHGCGFLLGATAGRQERAVFTPAAAPLSLPIGGAFRSGVMIELGETE